MKPIVFYNTLHNGDIHVSREFIKDIINKIDTQFYYYHNGGPKLLQDINIQYKTFKAGAYNFTNSQIIHEEQNSILINTWYNTNFDGYKKYGCTLKTLYENFKIIYEYLNIKIEPLEFYIPSFDFTKYSTQSIDAFIEKNTEKKKIYISNGMVQSGQSDNFSMDEIINKLSNHFSDWLFLISNPISLTNSNIIQTNQIIQIDDSDLCENAYLMTFCDVIIGRCSGTFSFGLIKDNLISESKQTWIGVCRINPKFGVDEFLPANKTFHWISNLEPTYVYNEITQILSRLNGNN